MIVTVSLNPAMDVDLEVERLHFEDRNLILVERRQPGGKGINVSRVIRELGGRTLAITTAGGRVGKELLARLREQKIPARFESIRAETRENLSISERKGTRSIRLNATGPRLSESEVRALVRAVEQASSRATFLVLSGSLPPNVPSDLYERLIRVAWRKGLRTALDADSEVLRRGIAARPWLVKPNRFEAERLLGRKIRSENQALAAAQDILQKWNVGVVFLSLGNKGAIIVALDERGNSRAPAVPVVLRADTPDVRVQSAIGAGDSALAAFLWRLTRGKDYNDALRWAMGAGAACAMTAGTELCRRGDVVRLTQRVKVLDWSKGIN